MSPGVNLLIYSCFAAALFLVNNITIHLAVSACVVVLLFFIPFRRVKGGIVPITLFLCFTFFSNAFYHSGRVLFTAGPFVMTDEGLDMAGIRTLRVFDMIFAAKVLTSVTPLEEMIGSLNRIFRPLERFRVPVHDFFSIMALTLKSFPLLKQRLQEVYRESIEGKGAIRFSEKMKLAVSFLVPVFVESMRNPEKFFEQEEKKD